jgi:hypothetical protein
LATATIHAQKIALAMDGDDPSRMLRRMTSPESPAATRPVARGELAAGASDPLPQDGSFTLFTGLPISDDPLPSPATAAEAVSSLTRLEGAFTAFHWDEAAKVLVVVSDPLGMAPLYWRRTADGIAWFSETKAVSAEPDLAGWGAFLAVGHPIGDRTLLAGVERFPAGTVLRLDTRASTIRTEKYWSPEPAGESWSPGTFVEALQDNVSRYARAVDRHSLFLSGGCDSRLILGLLRRLGIESRTRIVSHADELGDADGRCAVAAARAADMPYRFCHPEPDYFATQDFLGYVRAIDAACPSLGLFISKLYPFVPDGGVWDGLLPGFLFMNAHNPGGGFAGYRRQEVAGSDHAAWADAAALFGPERATAMRAAFEEDLTGLVSAYPDDSRGVAQFVLEQRARRRASQNPLKAWAEHATPLLPGCRRDIIEAGLALPHRLRAGGRFYRELLRSAHPSTLKAPLLSGGQPVPRGVLDPHALGTRLTGRLESLRRRHPTLLRARAAQRRPRAPGLPAMLRDEPVDDWIDTKTLSSADPMNARGFRLWRLYFHWLAWRQLHAPHPAPATGGSARRLEAQE